MTQRFNFKDFLARFIDEPEKSSLFDVLEKLPNLSKDGPWLAGGAIRKTLQKKALDSDFDFFFKDEKQRAEFEADLESMDFNEKTKTDHNTTYTKVLEDGTKIEVQSIHFKYYNTMEEIVDSFDFTITQFAYDGTDMVCGQYSLWDLARNRLALHKLTFGVSTVRRLIKYTKQDFTACSGCLADILQKTIDDPSSMQKEIKYID